MIRSIRHLVPNSDGWNLAIHQTWNSARLDERSKPVLIVPGYGMNSSIFGRQGGPSLERTLVEAGLEVWRVDLRDQGGSVRAGGSRQYSLEDLALTDMGAVVEAALDRTRTSSTQVTAVGASLGGTIVLAHAALRTDHAIGSFVSIGTPVRWIDVHPLLKIAFASPTLVGWLPLFGTRSLAKAVLPHALRFTPWALSMYINAEHVDLAAIDELIGTVEDPNRFINRQIARWIADRDLCVKGTNVTDALARIREPLLCVVANADGIVPRSTAEFVFHNVASTDRTLLEVGTSNVRLAHADMFVSPRASDLVFEPIRNWIRAR